MMDTNTHTHTHTHNLADEHVGVVLTTLERLAQRGLLLAHGVNVRADGGHSVGRAHNTVLSGAFHLFLFLRGERTEKVTGRATVNE